MHLPVKPITPLHPHAPHQPHGSGVFAALFAALIGAGVAFWSHDRCGLAVVSVALGTWGIGCIVSAAFAAKPGRFAAWLRPLAEFGTFAVVAGLIWSGRGFLAAGDNAPTAPLQLFAVLLLMLALGFRFTALYAESLEQEERRDSLAPFARFLFLFCAAGALALFIRSSTGFDGVHLVALGGAVALAVFALEAIGRAALRFYQPHELRAASSTMSSGFLAVALRGGSPAKALAQTLESQLGVRLGDIWALSFVRERLPVVILGTTLLASAGSMFTAVPTGGQGVRVRLGQFIEPALEPGLHVGWPWPFERVEVVETGALREFSLGFERDIGGAILWAEKHFEGEKNLLVGSGEELLTVNVPIYFRIADPVAYLRHTADATIALTHLAERHLLALTAGHESFRLMTVDRDATAAELRRRLQAEADALRLGIAIAFVGLKDIHPPVAVAPAYQDVVSAEEEKEAHIYIGRQYAASVIPLAQEEANRLRTNARAEAASRLASASGEAARFSSLESAHRTAPELYRARLKLETLAATLRSPQKLVIDRSLMSGGESVTLDLRKLDGGGFFLDPPPAAPKP